MKKPPSTSARRGASGTNLVITAASLTATLGGWALLTVNDQTVTQAVAAQPPAIIQPVAAAPPELALAPLPTLVPRRERARAAQPAPAAPRQAVPQRRAAPAAPPAAARPAPAPPPPVAQTQSSR